MAVDPMEILRDVNPQAAPFDSPPDIANYREADVAGIACAFCSKFTLEGLKPDPENEAGLPVGYCHQWEANVNGWMICDRFASDVPTFDHHGREVWDMGMGPDEPMMSEIHFATGAVEEKDGFVVKEVLRTGEWPVIPTGAGLMKKPLRIIRDGMSSKNDGVIALSELVTNFRAGIPHRVQVPLSDESSNDHKNTTRLNTGFVRDLWIADEGEQSKLVAKIEFTEPEIKDKALRGTYDDVSCGIPWNLKVRGRESGACLEHVCITNKPFIDGLGPFLALSDGNEHVEVQIAHFGAIAEAPSDTETEVEEEQTPPAEETETEETEEPPEAEATEEPLSHNQQRDLIQRALVAQGLGRDYEIVDIQGTSVLIHNRAADVHWLVPFTVDGQNLSIAQVTDWVVQEGQIEAGPAPAQLSELQRVQQLRELRLSQQPFQPNEGGSPMTQLSLDGVELSDEQRAAIQSVLDENATLKKDNRVTKADQRVTELSELGLNERPGALKLYRQVFLSDDGGAAIVLLADDGREKERLTALDILDRFIEAVKGSDGKVVLSDQALVSGNDIKPPNNAEGEDEKPLENRVADAKLALGLKK
jgi:hypothetical protein